MKRYLVTGGAGFIGSNFIQYMLKKHPDVHIINYDKLTYAGNLENLIEIADDERYHFVHADICDAKAVRQTLDKFNPDYVINFAAESHVDRSIANPNIFADTNILGTLTLLNAVRDAWQHDDGSFGNHKYVQISTDEVYGSLSLEEPETFFYESTPLAPHSPYSASKASADMFVQAYADTYGLPINITRCSNNYGPYQFPEKLIPLIINNALHHEKLPIYGDGLNIRDWLYVEDHCKAIDAVISRGKQGEIYNIGGHNEYENIFIVKKIVTILSRLTNDPKINSDLIYFIEDRKGHDRRYGIAPDKIKKDLGWEPETCFDAGIEKTITWYLEHDKWMKNVTSGAYRDYLKNMYGRKIVLF